MMDAQTRIRKYQNTLYVSGIVVIAFNIWSVIRNVAALFLTDEWDNIMSANEDQQWVLVVSVVTTFIIVAADFALRVYVGLRAMAEGKGNRKGNAYIVVTVLMIIAEAAIAATAFFVDTGMSRVDLTITTLVEITSLANMCELVYSAVKLRKYYREAE